MKTAKYIVRLTEDERKELYDILNKGNHPARKVKRARILLELDKQSRYRGGKRYRATHDSIAYSCEVSLTTVDKVCKQYATEGFRRALERKKRGTPPIQPIITGEQEAKIIALACSEPPKGYKAWTLRLLENKVVELRILEKVSDTTIGRMLKKHR